MRLKQINYMDVIHECMHCYLHDSNILMWIKFQWKCQKTANDASISMYKNEIYLTKSIFLSV